MRRVLTISRKKWGKSTTKTEKVIRDAVPKPETLEEIDAFLKKARSVTAYDLARRFGIRMSVARRLLKEKEREGVVVPYIRESGFVVYTTPSEMDQHEESRRTMISDELEVVASAASRSAAITDDMESALAVASSAGLEKPSRHARMRREAGEKKERKDRLPEVVVEPLDAAVETTPTTKTKEEKPKKKAPKKKVEAKEDKPKKKAPKKKVEAKEEKPKKKAPKKKVEAKEEKPKKKAPKKTTKK